jgi:hypothetical protein
MKTSWRRLQKRSGRFGPASLTRRLACGSLVVAAILLLVGAPARAQVTASSSLQGTVKDIKEAVIPGATVTATNTATGATRTATTNEEGTYRFDLLPAGTYNIKVAATGFGDRTSENVELLVGKTNTLDFAMSPGAKAETVTVTSEVPLVDQQKTDVSLNITPKEVQDLPLNGRDLGNLAYLAPGAKPVDSYDPTKNRIAVFGINGSSGRNVNVTVNGIDNKDNTVGGPVMQFPLEAIQEFVISTQRFSAVNGRSEGAAVNVVTKSGGNKFHGSMFFFLRDRKLNAAEVTPPDVTTKQKPPFNRKQFGGSVGGPLYLPRFGEGGPAVNGLGRKTFFFFALERQKEATSIPVASDALAELNLVSALGAKPSSVIPTPYHDTRVNLRLDHTFNSKHSAFVSYSDQSNLGLNDQSGQRNDLSAGNFTKNRLLLGNLTLNSAFTNSVVNAATVGYQYWNNLIDTDAKVPTFVFGGGGSAVTFGTNTNVPQQSYQAKYQFKDDLSVTRGQHTFRTGVDYLWEPKLGGFFEFNPTLEIDFLDLPSVITTNRTKYPQGFATPGAVTGMSATAGDPYFNLPGGAKMFGVYFQDDWRLTRRLTLSLGLRWDKDFNLIGTKAQALSRTFLALKAINHPAARTLPHDDNRDFSPRVGFAWDVFGTGHHVVRGGYGLYYGQTFLNIPLFMIQQTNPTIFAGVFAVSSGGPGDATADLVPGTAIRLSNWRFGVDPLPTIPPAATTLGAGATGRIMDPDYRNPLTQQWNLGYSWQLNSYSAVEIDYTHVLGLHESKTVNINPQLRLVANESSARPLTAAFNAAGQPALGRIDLEASVGRSRYDGLNVSYRRRLQKNFTVNANYTLSKAQAYNGNSAAFRNRAFNPFNYFAPSEYGPTFNDTRHRFALSSIINLPGGFQLSPIMQWESARAFTAGYGGTFDVLGVGSGRGASHVILLNSSPNDLLAAFNAFGGTTRSYRDCLRSGQCSIAQFDNLRGQPYFQLDTRVAKNFKFREHNALSLILQVFDLTNRSNFGNNFGNNVRDPTTFRKPVAFITPSGVIVPHSLSAEVGVRFGF